MSQFVASFSRQPARISVVWYLGLIVAGGLLLMMPASQSNPELPIRRLDAVFTATSAACVTGLAVRSTGSDFSFVGQLVILGLIQVGGIGIMTVTTFVTLWLGGRQTLRVRSILADTLGAGGEPDLHWVLVKVIRWTLAFEVAGFVVLSIRFLFDYSFGQALWHALFHSVSAFCNAGFSLYDDSLTGYQGDVTVNAVIMTLVVCGGIGFPVMLDLSRCSQGSWNERWSQLMLHSKIMIVGTATLLLLGTLAFLVFEWHGVLKGMPWPRRLLVSLFQSTTCRTAGFNTVEFGNLTNAMTFISVLLMMIGAGPCSTGGGFKVSTMVVLITRGWATFRGHTQLNLARRTIPREVTDRALATAAIFSVVAMIALTLLLVLEQPIVPHRQTQGFFIEAVFEVVSSLGTVGLTTGMTPQLTEPGRVIVICLMFMGRLGPISVFAALSRIARDEPFEYAQESPLIG